MSARRRIVVVSEEDRKNVRDRFRKVLRDTRAEIERGERLSFTLAEINETIAEVRAEKGGRR